jgi:hypothetical protein
MKTEFANALQERSGLQKTNNQCFIYGITWGCDIDCPVLKEGNCELKDNENKELYEEYLKQNES